MPPTPIPVLPLRCGWCDKLLRESENPHAHTSTGICPECTDRFEADAQPPVRRAEEAAS